MCMHKGARAMTSIHRPIPDWDARGLLPPYLNSPTLMGGRSPYHVLLLDLVLRFADTAARQTLLIGLLDYRAALHSAGVLDGFQWLNGSFVEDTMQNAMREPNDIDVVSFLHLPAGQTQEALVKANASLFDPKATKGQYSVDAYSVVLDADNLPYLVRRTAYWNNLWSHDRNQQWKGYLEIDLSDSEDAAARAQLEESANLEVEK